MTKQEYEQKLKANQRISGMGLETTMHMPCPFCAEPDFLLYRIIDSETALAKGAVCQHCGRGLRGIFWHTGGGVTFEMVQTSGDDAPDWVAKIRRVADGCD